MSLDLNPLVSKLEVPEIRKFSNRVSDYPHAVNLTIGQPDFQTPPSVKDAMIKALNDNKTTYSLNQGLPELRLAVSEYMKYKYDIDYSEEEVLITNGASAGIDAVLRTILNPGDEVILVSPIYSGYIPLIEAAGAVPIIADTTSNDCKVLPEHIQSVYSSKTKAVLLNYPNNPTGAVLNKAEMDVLAEYFLKLDCYILSDEIYSENTFNHTHISFGSYIELRDRLIILNGLSKSHSMTGFRIGFCLAPVPLITHFTIIHAYNCICAAVPSQYAAINALTEARDAAAEMNKAYIERRDYCTKVLDDLNVKYITPDGAFYLFIDISPFGMDSYDFAVMALEKYGVVIVPGNAFTSAGNGYVRLSYAYHISQLETGMKRFAQMISKLQ